MWYVAHWWASRITTESALEDDGFDPGQGSSANCAAARMLHVFLKKKEKIRKSKPWGWISRPKASLLRSIKGIGSWEWWYSWVSGYKWKESTGNPSPPQDKTQTLGWTDPTIPRRRKIVNPKTRHQHMGSCAEGIQNTHLPIFVTELCISEMTWAQVCNEKEGKLVTHLKEEIPCSVVVGLADERI